MRMIATGSIWAALIVGLFGTGNVLAKNVPAPFYAAQSNFSGFANGAGPKGPSGDDNLTSGNDGELFIDTERAAGFFPAAR